jgi:hypothetical protein
MAFGRPTDYDPAFCERVIELGREGASKVEMAVELGVVRNTLDNWAAAHPDFLSALTHARDLSQVWWEKKGRSGLDSQGFNASLWGKNVSCRFPDDWTDKSKQELSGPGGKDLIPPQFIIRPVEPSK